MKLSREVFQRAGVAALDGGGNRELRNTVHVLPLSQFAGAEKPGRPAWTSGQRASKLAVLLELHPQCLRSSLAALESGIGNSSAGARPQERAGMAFSCDARQPAHVRSAHFAEVVDAADSATKPMGHPIARVAGKLPGYSAESGGLSPRMGNFADLEMKRACLRSLNIVGAAEGPRTPDIN